MENSVCTSSNQTHRGMDWREYRVRGKEMVDYIADYMEGIRGRRVCPDVSPGFLWRALPDEASEDGAPWDTVMHEFETFILPGLAHSQSPYMHAYVTSHSPASLLGDMLAGALNSLSFAWNVGPAATELDVVVTNWLGRMLGLPSEFLNDGPQSAGGGMFQNTCSEALLVSLLSARNKMAAALCDEDPTRLNERLVAYCSDQTHSSMVKGCQICQVRLRVVASDQQFSLRGPELTEAMSRDKQEGLVPFYVCATLGTTHACSFDNLSELGPICRDEGMWLHVDAAYAGTAMVCPEFKGWLSGVHHANSLSFLPCKLMLTGIYSCVMWAKDMSFIEKTLTVDQQYTNNKKSGLEINLMHRQLSLSRYFHSLKMWFMIRSTGVEGIRSYVRENVRLCQVFVGLVAADCRFEMSAPSHLGMAVFRLKGGNRLTELLQARLNSAGNVCCGLSVLRGVSAIRFFVSSQYTTEDDIRRDWVEIQRVASQVLDTCGTDHDTIFPAEPCTSAATSTTNVDAFTITALRKCSTS